MSSAGEQRAFSENIDRLADFAVQTFATLARKASVLTLGVALVALLVTGTTWLIGMAAFADDQFGWGVIGGLLVLGAVGPPLLATWRLRAIPRASNKLVSELRGLLRGNDDAKRIVIDTVGYDTDADDETAAGPSRQVPAVIYRSQQYTRLGTIASQSGNATALALALRRMTSLPYLLVTSLLLTLLGAFLGFVFFLIWIF